MSGIAEDSLRAPTKRAPMAMTMKADATPPIRVPESKGSTNGKSERRSAPASRDPSELLKPVP